MARNKVVYGDTVIMDITDTTAETQDVAAGKVFYNNAGERSTGTGDYMEKVSNPTANDILVTDANGQAIDSGVPLSAKQDKLTAGDNITIENNTISADDEVFDAVYGVTSYTDVREAIKSGKVVRLDVAGPSFIPTVTYTVEDRCIFRLVRREDLWSYEVASNNEWSSSSIFEYASTDQVAEKQDVLVSGTNIKTINNQSLLGSGNIDISGGGGVTNLVNGIEDGSVRGVYANNDIGGSSFSFGWNTKANGECAFAVGSNTAAGNGASALGSNAEAYGDDSHAVNRYTKASGDSQTAMGKYNIEDTQDKYALIVGNGNSSARSNAFTVDWDGNIESQGDVTDGNGLSISGLKSQLGNLASLTTDNKDNLVNAINEVYEKSGEPFRVKNWAASWSAGVNIEPCTTDKTNANLAKMVFSIDNVEGADYQIVGMIAYEVFDNVSGGNRLNVWPVCQFTGNGQKELSVRWVCAGTTVKTAKRINAWVLLKHR